MLALQRRRSTRPGIRLRAGTDGQPTDFVGYAAVFESYSEVMTMPDPDDPDEVVSYLEVLSAGCFAESLRSYDVRSLYHHDETMPLGRLSAANLQLTEDDHGLAFVNRIGRQSYATDLVVNIQDGNQDQNSFGFYEVEGASTWEEAPEGAAAPLVYRHHKVDLREISLGVTWAAYEATTLGTRGQGGNAGLSLRSARAAGQIPPHPRTAPPRTRTVHPTVLRQRRILDCL